MPSTLTTPYGLWGEKKSSHPQISDSGIVWSRKSSISYILWHSVKIQDVDFYIDLKEGFYHWYQKSYVFYHKINPRADSMWPITWTSPPPCFSMDRQGSQLVLEEEKNSALRKEPRSQLKRVEWSRNGRLWMRVDNVPCAWRVEHSWKHSFVPGCGGGWL